MDIGACPPCTVLFLPYRFGADGVVENVAEENSSGSLVLPVRLDDIASEEEIWLLKLDVEGTEVEALRTAKRMLQQRRVVNVFLEWDKVRTKDREHETRQMLQWLLQVCNYRLIGLPTERYGDRADWQTQHWKDNAENLSNEADPYSRSLLYDDIWLQRS
jgi:hypothetical protein